jgi:3-isopropylmalate/(R)-2-methylmalate dehydratase small subunit
VALTPFTTHTGVAVPLRRSNIDTDQILPSRFLKRITRSGYEDALFAAWRDDPTFVLNRPRYAQASVLVAGPDFGTGSSREPAVWALQDGGFRVIVSARFADIFRTNAGKCGLLTVALDEPVVERLFCLLEAKVGAEVSVDLETRTVRCGAGFTEPFAIDDYTRWRLLGGLDDIAISSESASSIDAYERQRPGWLPVIEVPA